MKVGVVLMSQSVMYVVLFAVVWPLVRVMLLRVMVCFCVTPKIREALLPLIVMPSVSRLASIVRAAD